MQALSKRNIKFIFQFLLLKHQNDKERSWFYDFYVFFSFCYVTISLYFYFYLFELDYKGIKHSKIQCYINLGFFKKIDNSASIGETKVQTPFAFAIKAINLTVLK